MLQPLYNFAVLLQIQNSLETALIVVLSHMTARPGERQTTASVVSLTINSFRRASREKATISLSRLDLTSRCSNRSNGWERLLSDG